MRAAASLRSFALCSASPARTICAPHDGSGPRKTGRPLPRQRPLKGERPLSNSAPAAAAAALEAEATGQDSDFLPAHRALQMLSRYRALVLDSAYRPIDVVNWQRAICLDLMEKVDVLEYYDATMSSVSQQFFVPAVLRTRWYRGNAKLGRVPLNRRNVMMRDKFQCQYCSSRRSETLTIDHVVPQCKGGPNTWENLVTACSSCNTKKGGKTLKELRWKLPRVPKEPSPWDLNPMGMVMATIAAERRTVPTEWSNYLFHQKE